MGIKSTQNIKRESAIKRILEIDTLIIDKNYREIESMISEDSNLASLVDDTKPLNLDEDDLLKWTDTMLGDKMDEPLYRFSMFDNYHINDNDEE